MKVLVQPLHRIINDNHRAFLVFGLMKLAHRWVGIRVYGQHGEGHNDFARALVRPLVP